MNRSDVLRDLPRLVGGARHDQVVGQLLPEFGQLRVDVLAELADVSVRAHLDGDRDGAAALPVALRVAPLVEVQVSRRAVVAALDVHHVAQVDGRPLLRAADGYVADLLFALKLAGRVDGKVLPHGFQLTAGRRDVARAQDVRQVSGLEAVRGDALLGVEEKDLLGQDARARHLRGLRDALEPLLDDVGEIIHLAVAVLVAHDRAQLRARLLRVADHHGRPAIRDENRRPATAR